jgi:hypothetical protein
LARAPRPTLNFRQRTPNAQRPPVISNTIIHTAESVAEMHSAANAAAVVVTRFMRRLKRCALTGGPVPFARQFFTSPDVCCDTMRLAHHYVRSTCADEWFDPTPRCVLIEHHIVPATALLCLCRRTATEQGICNVTGFLKTCIVQSRYATPAEMLRLGWGHVVWLAGSSSDTVPPWGSILLYRLGWEAIRDVAATAITAAAVATAAV